MASTVDRLTTSVLPSRIAEVCSGYFLTHPNTSYGVIDLREAVWFDRDSEWPRSYQEMEQLVSQDPSAAEMYHLVGWYVCTYDLVRPYLNMLA